MHNRQDKDISEPTIITAARSGNMTLLAKCISHYNISEAINVRDSDGKTALYWAAAKGHTKAVQLLLSVPDINANADANIGWTPLQIAAFEGHAPCTQALLDYPDTDVNAGNNSGTTALILAASFGHTACVQALLASPDINLFTTDACDGKTAIFHAALYGHTACVQAILAAPGFFRDPHAATKEFDHALYIAANRGDITCVQALLASPNANLDLHHRDRHELYERLFKHLTLQRIIAETSGPGVRGHHADIYEMIINLILKAALKAKHTLNATATNSTDASKYNPDNIAARDTSKSTVAALKLFGTSTARQAVSLTRQDNGEIKYPRASL